MTAHKTLNHLIAEHSELQYKVILTMDSAQGTNRVSSIFAYHTMTPILAAPIQIHASQPKPVTPSLCHDSVTIKCNQTQC